MTLTITDLVHCMMYMVTHMYMYMFTHIYKSYVSSGTSTYFNLDIKTNWVTHTV